MVRRILADGLVRRFQPALLTAVGFITFIQFIMEPALARLTFDAPVINVAGRQRMLSQKLAKTALAINAAQTSTERAVRRRELSETVAAWEQAHIALQRGDGRIVVENNAAPIQAALTRLNVHFLPMLNAARQIDGLLDEQNIALRNAAIHGRVSTILLHEENFLQEMETIVGLFEAEARAHVHVLRRTGWMIMAGIGLALVAVGIARRQSARRMSLLAEQLAHASRLNTLGEMATSLAHEINQPLGAIANYAEGGLARIDFGEADPAELRSALQRISTAALRAGEILRRIRGFVRRQDHQFACVGIGPLIVDVESFCRAEADRCGVTVELDLASKLPDAWADAIQIQQVLVNLIRNAIQAMQSQPPGDRHLSVRSVLNSEHQIEIAVQDTGEGFDPRHAETIFEPFYTTHPGGLGMGLGISRSIVEDHRGRLWAESRYGHGATFRLTLPCAPAGGGNAD